MAEKAVAEDISIRSLSDLEILEQLRNMLYQAIRDNEPQPKVGDLMKVIELKKKLAGTGQAEKKFWDMIDTIRKEELGKPKNAGGRLARKSNRTK